MKRLVVLSSLLVVLAAIIAGCGGGGTKTVTVTSSPEGSTTASSEASAPAEETETVAESEAAESSAVEEELEEIHAKTAEAEEAELESEESESGDCEAMGINSEQMKEGTCESEGVTLVVVNHDSPLKLKTMKVKLLSVKKAKTLSSDLGSETASGTWVTFEIEVTNLTHAPVSWEEEQSHLDLSENEYSEEFEVQNGTEQDSLQWQSQKIQPENSVTGTVTFDVPNKVLKNLYAEGNLDFLNFGESGFYSEGEPEELGIIRTYH